MVMQKKSNLNPKFSQEFKHAQHHAFIIDHVQLKNTKERKLLVGNCGFK
jgi:hypothetical protein